MRRLAALAEQVAGTSRTSEKVRLLAAYLRDLPAPELSLAVVYLSGRPFPESDPRTVGLGWAGIAAAAEMTAGPGAGGLGAAYDRSSDLGQAVGDLLAAAGHEPSGDPPSLPEVDAALAGIADARGPAAKSELFRALLARCDPLTAKYVTKILSGEMRIGLREGHLEAAIAEGFEQPLDDVKWAGMLTGDIGRTAVLARDRALGEARLRLFRPLKSMLASPAADTAEVFARLGAPVWVEDKYDGIRAQLHKVGERVALYSRDLHDVTEQFPEVVEAAGRLPWDGVLDGELLGWRDGRALPFQALQARLGRKRPSAAIIERVPTIFVAFDLLASGPGGGPEVEPTLREPLRVRRERLAALGLGAETGVGISNVVSASDEPELDEVFRAARERGNEGLMVKDPDSIYTPGRRGYGWLKLKRPLATLDCVVVGVEVGHGKRHGVLSDYTFAVIDDRPDAPEGRLAVIGKAYSGLTDAELAAMTIWFTEHTVQQRGRFRAVEPSVVVEVAFDVIMRSERHDSGYALRFPRIVRIRTDKPPSEVDRLSTVARMQEQLAGGAALSMGVS
jgi:DNA ligase 1